MPTAWLLGCASGADPFIEKYFSDCVYSLRDYIGFCLGLAAILFWIVAQVPQWLRNYRTKNAEALSPWFLAQWLLGDTFNLLGCLLQGQQLPTTTYTAMYFVVADVFMMMQYIYYGALQRRKEKILQLQVHRRHHPRRHHQHGSGRTQQHSPGAYAHIAGLDSSTKEHGVYQRQQPHQQQSRRQWQQHSAELQADMASSSHHNHSRLHPHKCQEQEQQQQLLQPEVTYHLQQQLQPGSVWQGSSESPAGQALLPQSCATAARLQSVPRHGLMLGSVHLGGYKSAVAVGVLVTLGVVSLAVPANTTWGVIPAEAALVAAPQRAMQAGSGSGAEALHSISAHTSNGDTSLAIAGAGMFTSQIPAQHSSSQDTMQNLTGPERDLLFVFGTMLGYCSSVLYLCSRLSQIHKNHTRKSSEGLALAMFMMAVCANLCTGTGIVMRTFTVQELKEQLPWIIGSLGTISLDMIILWQSIRYGDKEVAGGGMDTPTAIAAAHHQQQQQQVTVYLNRQQHTDQREQQQQQQRSQPDQTVLTLAGQRVAAAYYRSSTLPPTAAISIPITQHKSGSNAGVALWSSSAPVTAGWECLRHHQTQHIAAAGIRDEAVEDITADAAAPLLAALN